MALALVFGGCATGYKKIGFNGGFSEEKKSENKFQVSFKGNRYTHRIRATDFNLLRSAEVTLENGFRYFVIQDSQCILEDIEYTTPTSYYGKIKKYGDNYIYDRDIPRPSSAITFDFFGKFTIALWPEGIVSPPGGLTYYYFKPCSVNTIICFKGRPENKEIIFDAVEIKQFIKSKYSLWL